ncbi:hypothetical protein KJ865_09115 [Myxococcota bacterium]|nr:hypothetical protein [Myxococcota bacterium]
MAKRIGGFFVMIISAGFIFMVINGIAGEQFEYKFGPAGYLANLFVFLIGLYYFSKSAADPRDAYLGMLPQGEAGTTRAMEIEKLLHRALQESPFRQRIVTGGTLSIFGSTITAVVFVLIHRYANVSVLAELDESGVLFIVAALTPLGILAGWMSQRAMHWWVVASAVTQGLLVVVTLYSAIRWLPLLSNTALLHAVAMVYCALGVRPARRFREHLREVREQVR